jgi:hypothetical protein
MPMSYWIPLLHIQRLVRTFAIELFAKAIKPALLTAAGVSCRSRGLGFERAMHALVPAAERMLMV